MSTRRAKTTPDSTPGSFAPQDKTTSTAGFPANDADSEATGRQLDAADYADRIESTIAEGHTPTVGEVADALRKNGYKLADSTILETWQELRARPNGDPRLKQLATSTNPDVRAAVAANPAITPRQLRTLAQDETEPEVIQAVAANPQADDELLEQIRTDWQHNPLGTDVIHAIAANPNTSSDTLAMIARYPDNNNDVLWDVANHPNTRAETLEHLATTNVKAAALKTITNLGTNQNQP